MIMTFNFSRFQVSILLSLYVAAAVLVIPLIDNKLIDRAQAKSSKVIGSKYFSKSLNLAQTQDSSSVRSDGTILANAQPFFPIGFFHPDVFFINQPKNYAHTLQLLGAQIA